LIGPSPGQALFLLCAVKIASLSSETFFPLIFVQFSHENFDAQNMDKISLVSLRQDVIQKSSPILLKDFDY
jgi:hypothetical protein